MLNGKVDIANERLNIQNEKLGAQNQRFEHFPTRLQLALWGGAGLTLALGVAGALLALLLRLSGHVEAAAALDAVRGEGRVGLWLLPIPRASGNAPVGT